jgi:hypothetical protein
LVHKYQPRSSLLMFTTDWLAPISFKFAFKFSNQLLTMAVQYHYTGRSHLWWHQYLHKIHWSVGFHAVFPVSKTAAFQNAFSACYDCFWMYHVGNSLPNLHVSLFLSFCHLPTNVVEIIMTVYHLAAMELMMLLLFRACC